MDELKKIGEYKTKTGGTLIAYADPDFENMCYYDFFKRDGSQVPRARNTRTWVNMMFHTQIPLLGE